jgi:thiol-disulfide isomerase/thioredoxin
MKIFKLVAFLSFLITGRLAAQDALPPDYLVKQNFPDSVRNLTLLTIDSTQISFEKILAKHAGKKILIDFWASWCKDCIVGHPKLVSLMNEIDSAKVVLIYISVDKDGAKWRGAIERFGFVGEHYRSQTAWNNTLSNYIGLDWIPRYIVLDERGKVIMPKAISADHPALRKLTSK